MKNYYLFKKRFGHDFFDQMERYCLNEKIKNTTLVKNSLFVAGPIIFFYTYWVLNEAQKLGLKRLYFLSRDGHILKQVAEAISIQYHFDIECKYLYCSRASLRLPTYHFLSEEKYDLLFSKASSLTMKNILDRVFFTDAQRMLIYEELKFNCYEENTELTFYQFNQITEKLKKNKLFNSIVDEKSEASFQQIMGYFLQEGLFNDRKVAIVDSGWAGSMQRSMRQLLERAGFHGEVIGFYFGMFSKPHNEDSTYFTWYFNWAHHKYNKILFNNNLLECMLSAPHGMTTQYECINGIFVPIFKSKQTNQQLNSIKEQQAAIMYFTRTFLENNPNSFLYSLSDFYWIEKVIRRFMIFPTKEEANAYRDFMFCDDVSESYSSSIVEEKNDNILKQYNILYRIKSKLRHEKKEELFWPYGTIAFLPTYRRLWYLLNLLVWDWLRYTIR